MSHTHYYDSGFVRPCESRLSPGADAGPGRERLSSTVRHGRNAGAQGPRPNGMSRDPGAIDPLRTARDTPASG